MSEEIDELRRQLASLRYRVNRVRRRTDGIPPLGTWAKAVGEGFGDLLRDPDDAREVENLRRRIAEVETWLSENE